MTRVYMTGRSLQLVWMSAPANVPVLTVENYQKWYCLYLVHPDGAITEVGFGVLDKIANGLDRPPYCDHAPNPTVVQRLAVERGWHLDPNAFEMLIGRHAPNPTVVQRLAVERGWHLDPNAFEMLIGRREIECANRYGEDV